MSRFRKKPVVIEAVQFTNSADTFRILQWINAGQFDGDKLYAEWQPENGTLTIPTLEGVMLANIGDWIIRGVKGEFYPCRDDIFRATYDPVDTDTGSAGPQPLDAPDGPGHFAYWHEDVKQILHFAVARQAANIIVYGRNDDNRGLVYEFMSNFKKIYPGKFYRLTMPWDNAKEDGNE